MGAFNKTVLLALAAAVVAAEEDRATKMQANLDAQVAAAKAQADADTADAVNKKANADLRSYIDSLDEEGNEPGDAGGTATPPADTATDITAGTGSSGDAGTSAPLAGGTPGTPAPPTAGA